MCYQALVYHYNHCHCNITPRVLDTITFHIINRKPLHSSSSYLTNRTPTQFALPLASGLSVKHYASLRKCTHTTRHKSQWHTGAAKSAIDNSHIATPNEQAEHTHTSIIIPNRIQSPPHHNNMRSTASWHKIFTVEWIRHTRQSPQLSSQQ